MGKTAGVLVLLCMLAVPAVATAQGRRRPRPPRPSPTAVYSVPVGNSPVIGAPDAKVTMVVSVDFSSPYSNRIRVALESLANKYGNDLRIVFKHFVVYPTRSTQPALAACAAHRQRKFLAMEQGIWQIPNKAYTVAKLEAVAKAVGLNMRRFRRDMKGRCKGIIKADRKLFTRLGARGVPASFTNGRFLSGAQPFSNFDRLVAEELRKANQRIRKGARKRTYYRNWIVKRGKRTP